MTINQAIVEWLYTNGTIEIDDHINTDILDASKSYAVSKEPTNVTERKFVGGGSIRTEYYQVLAKRNTQFEQERISNDEFLQNLEMWVHQKNRNRDFPDLGDTKTCDSIGISSGYYLYSSNEEESIYTLTIEITYRTEEY